jgi:hypothetical protein
MSEAGLALLSQSTAATFLLPFLTIATKLSKRKRCMKSSPPSNRSFGFLFVCVFALISSYVAYHGSALSVIYGWLIAAVVMALATLIKPELLTPFHKAWLLLGELMGKIVSPIVLGIIFFFMITPVGSVTRLFGRDELRLKRRAVVSHWIVRDPPGPDGDTFINQF